MNMIEIALDKVRSSVHGKRGSSRPGKCWRGAFAGPEETPAGCIKMEEISGRFASPSGGSESSSASASEVGDELSGMRHLRSIMKETELAAAAGVDVPVFDQALYHDYSRKADMLENAQEFFIQSLNKNRDEPVKQYLLQRGYTEQDIRAVIRSGAAA